MSTDLEHAVLATVLTYGAEALAMAPELSTADFSHPSCRKAFAACARLQAEDSPIGYATVHAELQGDLVAQTAVAALGVAPFLGELPAHARKLRAAARLRDAVAAARRIVALESGNGTAPEDRFRKAQALAQEILRAGLADDGPLLSLGDVAEEEIRKLERITSGAEKPERLRFGIPDLDEILYVEPGDLVIVGGETSSGKSAFCGQVAARHAKTGKGCVFVTSEMSHRQMLARITAAVTGRSVAALVNPRTAADSGAVTLYQTLRDYPLWFQRSFPPRIEDAVTAIRSAVARHGVTLAVIDYAQRLANGDEENQERAIGAIAQTSKDLALELGIVVLAAAQVNRQISHRGDPRPTLADLRGSGRIEQDANTVLFVYQPKRHGIDRDAEIIVAKQRNGRTGVIESVFREETCTFESLAR